MAKKRDLAKEASDNIRESIMADLLPGQKQTDLKAIILEAHKNGKLGEVADAMAKTFKEIKSDLKAFKK